MSKTSVPSIPAPTDANLKDVARAVKGVLDVREGLIGDPLDKVVTFRDLQDSGIADVTIVGRGSASGGLTVLPGSGLIYEPEEPDLTPPPQPTNFVATAGLAVVILEWTYPSYSNHAFTEIWRSPTNVLGNAIRIATSQSQMYNDAVGSTGVTYYYWIRFVSKADVVGAYNGTNGTAATTGKVGNVDLGALIVEAGNLAANAVTAGKIAAQSVDVSKFATGLEPITVVAGSTVPTTKSTNTIFLAGTGKIYRWNGSAYTTTVPTADLSGTIAESQIASAAITTAKFASGIEPLTIVTGALPTTKSTSTIFRTDDSKTYRWNGTAYVATVATTDLSGTISDAQIVGLAASKITGQLTNTQIADLAAAKLTGTISQSQIADGSVSGSKFASGIEPVTVVSSVPGTKSTNTIFNTTDGKLYRWSGSSYVASVPASDLSGQVTASQVNIQVGGGNLVQNASFEVDSNSDGLADNWGFYTGGTTPSLSTSALYGSKAQRFLADGVASVPRLTITSNRPKLVSGQAYVLTAWVNLTGTAYLSFKTFSAASGGSETSQGTAVATLAVSGTYQRLTLKFVAPNSDFLAPMIGASGTPAAGTAILVDGVQVELGDVATAFAPKADEILPGTITSTEISDNAVTTAKLVAGAVVAGKIAANAVSATEIAAGAVTTAKIAAGAVTANEIAADTITAGQIAAGAISASELAAGAVTAGKIAANAVTATEIAAGSVTTAKIAAGAVTANEIAVNAITAVKIDAGAVTTAKIAAGAVTANEIAAATITGSKIAAGTITGSNIAADTITAGQIAAGAVSASELAVGAVRAQHILVAPKSLNPDPTFSAGSDRWSGFVQRLARSNAAVPANCPAPFAAEFSLTNNPWSYDDLEVVPGEVYRLSVWVSGGATGVGSIGGFGRVFNADGVTVVDDFVWPGTVAATTGWQRVSGLYTIPANGARLRVGPWANRPTYTGASWFADLNVERVNDASLIVDGAITASKLSADSVTADKIVAGSIGATKLAANAIAVGSAAIENGAIVNAMIGDATISSAKIAAVSVTKLTAGALQVGAFIQSADYVQGVSGWRINADGTAELNNVLARGNINATSGSITGASISNATSGQRIVIDNRGLLFLTGASSGKYGTFKYGAKKYGSGVLVYFNSADKKVPFYVSAEQNVADIHLYNRGANPTGATYEDGDMICVNGRLKIYVSALGGWKTVALE